MAGGTAGHAWLDLAFTIDGGPLPRDHRRALAAAVDAALPWLCRRARGRHPAGAPGAPGRR
jgi:hypothetical protein